MKIHYGCECKKCNPETSMCEGKKAPCVAVVMREGKETPVCSACLLSSDADHIVTMLIDAYEMSDEDLDVFMQYDLMGALLSFDLAQRRLFEEEKKKANLN